jgi:hypothetical protein
MGKRVFSDGDGGAMTDTPFSLFHNRTENGDSQ